MKKRKVDYGVMAAVALVVAFVGISMGIGMSEIWFYFGGKPL